VTTDSGEVPLNRRPRTVLLCLLLNPNRSVSWDKVAQFLWGDDPPKTQRNSVARFVADLRRALGPDGDRIVTEGGGYRVIVHQGELDSDTARTGLAEAKRLAETDLELAHGCIGGVMELVGTAPNEWLIDLPEVAPILSRNQELRIEVLETLARFKLDTGRHAELIAVLEQGVLSHPYHERLWAHLIDALHRSARTVDALRACQRLRAELAEIGLVPSDSIHRLEAHIVAGTSIGSAADMHAVVGAPIGRESDLHAIQSGISAHSLVSIVGLAGSGKSMLATAVSDDEELDGSAVHRIDLRSLRDAARVVPTVAAAVGVPASAAVATPAELATHLASISCLIVLDNCEHLRPECAALAEELVSRASGVRILATSREPLRAGSEHVHRLNMLRTKATSESLCPSPAAELFVAKAAGHLGDGDPDESHLDHIEAICESLRGHPLAIDLAAGLLGDTPVSELRARLDSTSIASPGNAVTVALDVAWDSLSPAGQTLLARLSVFAGGCTLAAAERVCGEGGPVLADLSLLTERGFVTLAADDRYVLDAPIREFASARLSDRRETRVFLGRLTDWLRELTAPWGIAELGSIAEAGDALVPEQANVTEALVHLLDIGHTEELAWFFIRCCGPWVNHGLYSEVVRWLGPIVDDETVSDAARSAAAAGLLQADMLVGNFAMLAPWGEKSLALAGGESYDWIPIAVSFLALLSLVVPISKSTEELLDLSESTARRSDSRDVNTAWALMRRAHVAHHRRDYDGAVDHFREALALVNDPGRLLLALETGEAISLYLAGRHEESLESVRGWKSQVETDDWHYQVDIVRAVIVGGCGQPAEATVELAAALRRHKPASVWARADEFQIAFGLLADMRGEPKLAADLLATPMSGSPFLSSIVIERIAVARGLDDDGRREVSMEMLSRVFPEDSFRSVADSEEELVSWWTSGSRSSSRN